MAHKKTKCWFVRGSTYNAVTYKLNLVENDVTNLKSANQNLRTSKQRFEDQSGSLRAKLETEEDTVREATNALNISNAELDYARGLVGDLRRKITAISKHKEELKSEVITANNKIDALEVALEKAQKNDMPKDAKTGQFKSKKKKSKK
jgi:chromosome segregation ATPase